MNETVPTTPKPRRPWLAALLSLLTGWLGQLYNGQPRRAMVAFSVGLVFSVILTFAPPRTFSAMAALFAVALVWRLAVAVDACLQARRLKSIRLARYNRIIVYVGLTVAVAVLGFGLNQYRHVESFSIASESDLPTLQQGERVAAYSITPGDLARGDMVILHLPRDSKITYVKRIVGLPGDRVGMWHGQVLINNVPLHRTEAERGPDASSTTSRTFVETTPEGKGYLVLDAVRDSTFDTVQQQRVPEGHYWVLGDNRDNSLDSRAMFQVGFVPAQNIYRKVAYIYWSRDLSRIGMAVE
jgi:signal peptidase I